jgi:hypothetical protein
LIPERARVAGPLVFRHQTPFSTGRTLDTSRNGQRVNSIAANSGTRRERGYEIDLVPPAPSAGDVHHSIKKAMERNAKLDADSVSVDSSNGTSRSTEP